MASLPARIESAVQDQLRDRGVFGAAVCAFSTNDTLFSGGVGYADVASATRVLPSTVFRAASVSKLLTTTLLLRLANTGRLDLDTPANEYLPSDLTLKDVSGRPAQLTVASLLSHSSGLPGGVRGADIGNRALSYISNQGTVTDLASAISGVQQRYSAGERVIYSNPAFNVAGHIAALVTGTSFEEAAQSEVLDPLSMSRSKFVSERSGEGVATQYGSIVPPSLSSKPTGPFRLLATPMGGLTTTAEDLAKFGQMVLRHGTVETGSGAPERFLSDEILDRATSIEASNFSDIEQGFGLGFKVWPWHGRTLLGHDGNMPGVSTQFVLSPSDGVGVVVLINGFALGVAHKTAVVTLRHILEMEPEDHSHGRDAASSDETYWSELGHEAEGSYNICDGSPPGIVGRVGDLMTRVKVIYEAHGRLRIEGFMSADGPVWLLPEAKPGRYRISSNVDSGTAAVIERRPDGIHIWFGFVNHLLKRS